VSLDGVFDLGEQAGFSFAGEERRADQEHQDTQGCRHSLHELAIQPHMISSFETNDR
jgi:hypothetical protein